MKIYHHKCDLLKNVLDLKNSFNFSVVSVKDPQTLQTTEADLDPDQVLDFLR